MQITSASSSARIFSGRSYVGASTITVPVVLGRAKTLRVLHGINVLLLLLTLAVPLLGLARPAFALLGTSCLYAWAYLRRAGSSEDIHFLCDVVSEGEQLVLAGVVLLGIWGMGA